MTTEERFVKIENTLEVVTENLARHEAAIRDLIVVSRTLLDSQKELQETHQRDHEAWRETIRDVARQIAESRREVDDKLKALTGQTAETDKRLNALIEIVDEIIRRRKNGES
jgi:hypothetical protein